MQGGEKKRLIFIYVGPWLFFPENKVEKEQINMIERKRLNADMDEVCLF